MAHGHWNAGEGERAAQLCHQVLAIAPGHAEALHLLGLIAYASGRSDEAVEFLVQACNAPGAPALFCSNLAEIYRQQSRLAEAEAAARRAVAADPALAQAWNNLGIVLQEQGRLECSLDCLTRALALNPSSAAGFGNLGNTLKKLGRLEAAVGAYEKALAINPDAGEVHSNFSVTLVELGRFDAARHHAARAIEIDPHAVDACLVLAEIESRLGRKAEALVRVETALCCTPENTPLLLARAELLMNLDRLDEALISSRRAVVLAPAHGDAHNTHGTLLQAAGRYKEAMAAFDRAAQLLPQPAAALGNRAALLMETGRGTAAMSAFDEALRLQPALASVWFNRADAKTFAAGDPDIATMEGLLSSGAVQSYDDRMRLHFALGKAYLDAQQTGPAFTHLAEGNRLKRATISYDPDAAARWMGEIARQFSAERFARLGRVGMASAAPVFLIGMPRSGTTLVEQVLAAHPEVHGAGELPFVRQLVDRVFGSDRSAQPYPQWIGRFGPADYAEFARHYLAKIARLAPGSPRIIDKMPANFLYAGLIHLALPDARIIHCRRDALDTCFSCYGKLFSGEQDFAYDLAELGQFYRGYRDLTDHWRQVLPASRFIEVDYADVVTDLRSAARRLVDFLGLAWDEACLDFYRSRRPVKTASLNQVRQPIYTSSLGRAQQFRAYLGPLIDALGDSAEQPAQLGAAIEASARTTSCTTGSHSPG